MKNKLILTVKCIWSLTASLPKGLLSPFGKIGRIQFLVYYLFYWHFSIYFLDKLLAKWVWKNAELLISIFQKAMPSAGFTHVEYYINTVFGFASIIYISTVLQVKRFRDMGHPAWYGLISSFLTLNSHFILYIFEGAGIINIRSAHISPETYLFKDKLFLEYIYRYQPMIASTIIFPYITLIKDKGYLLRLVKLLSKNKKHYNSMIS